LIEAKSAERNHVDELTEAETAESFYLGGAWRHSTGDAIPVINPADERVLASVPSATADEVHQALLAAKSAQRGHRP
jgi:acyl-CoA reductase-like NAD-dependent aldehyde dehydrogenase